MLVAASDRYVGWRLRWLTTWLAIAFTAIGHVFGQTVLPEEYQLKAVFLFNFTLFTTWPPEAFSTPDAPIVIGVVGDDPFGQDLDDVARGETVQDRRVVVQRFRRLDEVASCHVLFISRTQDARLAEILARVHGRPVLTVGESAAFVTAGGIIRFVTENRKVRLQINLDAARAAELTLSSKLLRSAEIVSSRN